MIENTTAFFERCDVKHKINVKLSELSSVKIGGMADIVACPDTEKKLVCVFRFLKQNNINFKVLGRMSNVLVSDGGFRGVVVKTDGLSDFSFFGNSVKAYAGCNLVYLSKSLAKAGLSGFEELSGIPGSVGGAVYGNAGAFGREISELVKRVTVIDLETLDTFDLGADELNFSYRHSLFKIKNIVLLSALFDTVISDKEKIEQKIMHCADVRKSTQPVGYPSLGSVFKRPRANVAAGYLIDRCGLKGYTVGGAKISEKHAGFIINAGGASAADYVSLANFAATSVKRNFSVELEWEVEKV